MSTNINATGFLLNLLDRGFDIVIPEPGEFWAVVNSNPQHPEPGDVMIRISFNAECNLVCRFDWFERNQWASLSYGGPFENKFKVMGFDLTSKTVLRQLKNFCWMVAGADSKIEVCKWLG